jgi:hypothetical protein
MLTVSTEVRIRKQVHAYLSFDNVELLQIMVRHARGYDHGHLRMPTPSNGD